MARSASANNWSTFINFNVIVVFHVDSAFSGGRFTTMIAARGDERVDFTGFVHPASASIPGNEFRNTSVTVTLSLEWVAEAELETSHGDAVVRAEVDV